MCVQRTSKRCWYRRPVQFNWKKWAAKHENELKEGAWLEPGLALVRKKEKGDWTEKASQCGQEDLFGTRLDAKKIIRCWMVGHQSVSSLSEGGRHRKAQALPLSRMARSEARYSGSFQEMGAKGGRKKWKWQRGIVEHPLSGSQWNRDHFSMRKCESEKHKTWSMQVEGFRGHVSTDGSLQGNTGKWRACGWAVVQLDHDGEMGSLHGM